MTIAAGEGHALGNILAAEALHLLDGRAKARFPPIWNGKRKLGYFWDFTKIYFNYISQGE